jgi:hypothetical protein
MVVWHLLLAIITGVIFTALFAPGFRRSGEWASLLAFFTILFLAAWAGGVWIVPVGPSIGEVFWLPFLLTGMVIALLIAVLTPPRYPRSSYGEAVREEQADRSAAAILRFSFWALLLLLIAAIAAGYIVSPFE